VRSSLLRAFVFFLFIGSMPFAHAGLSCNITKSFDRDDIKNDASFWEEFGRLSAKGELTDSNVEELLKKRSVEVRVSETGPDSPNLKPKDRRVSAPQYSISHQAQKEIGILPPALRRDLDDFLEVARGGRASLQTLRDQQGRWQFKRLDGKMRDVYSVRLNVEYRVGFKIMDDNTIQIIGVNKRIGH